MEPGMYLKRKFNGKTKQPVSCLIDEFFAVVRTVCRPVTHCCSFTSSCPVPTRSLRLGLAGPVSSGGGPGRRDRAARSGRLSQASCGITGPAAAWHWPARSRPGLHDDPLTVTPGTRTCLSLVTQKECKDSELGMRPNVLLSYLEVQCSVQTSI